MLERMADAIYHRGPDEEGYYVDEAVGLAHRRLSIVGLSNGRQPIFNEDRTVAVVYNGELFDYIEVKAELEAKGHRFTTDSDTEILVHLWEEYGESMVERLRGQFAFVLYDMRKRKLILARDRIGICPLFWAKRQGRLYFGSEIKAILASGEVRPEADRQGIDHVFNFIGMPSRRTAFKDISAIAPATFMRIDLDVGSHTADLSEHRYWDLDFPDAGEERNDRDGSAIQEEYESLFKRSVELRLRADVPVVGYLSGGVDSTTLMHTAMQVVGRSIPAYTMKIDTKELDETDLALLAAKRIGSDPTIIPCDGKVISGNYPGLITAAESPVIETSSSACFTLAKEVQATGYKVALSGEGGDDWLGGYPWLKMAKAMDSCNVGQVRPGNWIRRFGVRVNSPGVSWQSIKAIQDHVGGPNGYGDLYGMVSLSRSRFYSDEMWERIGDHHPIYDLDLNQDRLRRWHPLNRALYLGYKTMLPGLLLNHKGDRPAMHHSVETRYPFLDEAVVDFCATLHPKWKLRTLRRDKHLLRNYAAKILPSTIANRPKAVFRAPFADTFFANPPTYVDQLLSEESLKKTGYFRQDQVEHYRRIYRDYPRWQHGKRLVAEMGLAGVMATQLWHHLYLGGGLCELSTWEPKSSPARPSRELPRRESGLKSELLTVR